MRTKTWLIVATALIFCGCAVWIGTIAVLNWDLSQLSTVKFETNTHEIQDEYRHLRVVTDTADVTFVPSDDGTTKVLCFEEGNATHTVAVKDGTLTVTIEDTRKWYEHIGFFFQQPHITVVLPAGTYGALSVESDTGDIDIPSAFTPESVKITGHTGNVVHAACATGDVQIQTSTGNITVQNATVGGLSLAVSTGKVTVTDVECQGDVTLSVSTGKAHLTNLRCRDLFSEGDTGGIFLENVVANGRLTLERSTGDVLMERCDAAALFITTDTGDVKGTLLSDKICIATTDTGRVNVPRSAVGGRCEIVTDTGDISIAIT